MIEQIIAFDVRELIPDWITRWRPEWHRRFFLRDEIQQPYSVDEAVWPQLPHLVADLPSWFGPQRQSWDSLSAMDQYVNARGGYTASTMRIGIGLVLTTELEGWDWGEALEPGIEVSDLKGKLLGYDIANFYLLSGLSNVGYFEDQLATLKPVWSPHLNEHHLFTDVDKAMEFKLITDNRVNNYVNGPKPYLPFYVFSLYALEAYAE